MKRGKNVYVVEEKMQDLSFGQFHRLLEKIKT